MVFLRYFSTYKDLHCRKQRARAVALFSAGNTDHWAHTLNGSPAASSCEQLLSPAPVGDKYAVVKETMCHFIAIGFISLILLVCFMNSGKKNLVEIYKAQWHMNGKEEDKKLTLNEGQCALH